MQYFFLNPNNKEKINCQMCPSKAGKNNYFTLYKTIITEDK